MIRETVHVPLGDRSYDVRIGEDLIATAAEEIRALLPRPRVAVLTDETVAGAHLDALGAGLGDIDMVSLALTPGEATKSWSALEKTVEWMLAEKIERRDVMIALGGGVIGDLGGFASAILRRGIRYVQIPTSLLAQVDSSVGGKTAINSPTGKNLIGAFHQPSLVLADIGVLETLTPRDFLAGYGEVVKYGLLGDAVFFDWLETNGPALAKGGSQSARPCGETLRRDESRDRRAGRNRTGRPRAPEPRTHLLPCPRGGDGLFRPFASR